ncbi:MAG TPA: enoyl-CoA hydratase/isomerase family protein [Acidimicrobiia bacterium]|nr:enoyl-CoA hydratase/isomerase family protein [Acidimicrobiia bacterium]
MTEPVLLVDRPYGDAPAVRLTLNRPERKNALSIALRDAISHALDTLSIDESVRCVVVTGAGDVFSSGFDLTEFTAALDDAEFAARLWASSDRYHSTLVRFPLPTLAAVNGPALAGGFDLAICCDLRIATTTARFAHPEYTFGPVVYSPLHDLVGGAVARDLCMTGRSIDAAEALALRVVNDVVDPDQLDAATRSVVERICAAPREQLLRTKAKALARARLVTDATLDL